VADRQLADMGSVALQSLCSRLVLSPLVNCVVEKGCQPDVPHLADSEASRQVGSVKVVSQVKNNLRDVHGEVE